MSSYPVLPPISYHRISLARMTLPPPHALPTSQQTFLDILPAEIRLQIYSHLIPHRVLDYPIRNVGVRCISHRPPPLSTLLVSRQFTFELLSYFYSVTTWEIAVGFVFNFFRLDPQLHELRDHPVARRVQKVLVSYEWENVLSDQYPSFELESLCSQIQARARNVQAVLKEMPELRSVTVRWTDTMNAKALGVNALGPKKWCLIPLLELGERVEVRLGEVLIASGGYTREDLEDFVTHDGALLGKELNLRKEHNNFARTQTHTGSRLTEHKTPDTELAYMLETLTGP